MINFVFELNFLNFKKMENKAKVNGGKNPFINNNEKFQTDIENYSREQMIYLIYLSDKCSRYETMFSGFEALIKKFGNLNKSERVLFEKPLKQLVQARQKKINKLNNLEKEASKQGKESLALVKVLNEEKGFNEAEIKSLSKRALKLIDNHLLKFENDNESLIFYNKLKADLYKYLSQVEEDFEKYLELADNFYREAVLLSNKHLDTLHPMALASVLSYGKFLLFFKKNNEAAVDVFKNIYNIKKVQDILEGTLETDQETLGYLSEIKGIITTNVNN
jgi:hypothetical protein